MNKPKLILLVGVPGSGKTTYAKKYMECNSNTIHLSSDLIRKELYGAESIQGNPAEVFSLMQTRAIESLNEGYDVLYDATNITRKDRSAIISICPKFARVEAYIIWAPIETCIERDTTRNRTVGKEVIDRMLKKFQAPFFDEGIDEIEIIRTHHYEKYPAKCFEDIKISHDNPHHTLSIYDHCMAARDNVQPPTHDMYHAAWWHDIGKSYVKSFTDAKGNPCDTAHYYQHQCVGAWMSYGLFSVTPKIAWLISTHMDPFLNTKYWRDLPPFLKKDIDLLHEADLAAH